MIRLSRAQSREIDRLCIEEYGLPGIVLMENAARSAAEEINFRLRGDGVDGRGSHVLFAVERAVDIELDLVARLVEGNGDMLPSAACHRIVAENVGRVDIRVVLVGRAQRKQGAAGAILLASESAVKVANEAVQALGGAGYTKDWPVERYLRDAKLLDIGAGTNEIRRMLIGRELIGAA